MTVQKVLVVISFLMMLTHSNTVFIIVHWSNAHQYTSEACSFSNDELGPVRYRTGTGTERTGTENPQKWVPVPVPNIPGSVRFGTGTGSVPVFEGKNEQNTGPNRYRTGPVPNRYRKCQKWVPNRYRIGTRFGKFGTGTGSVPVRYRYRVHFAHP
ncbi:hypothetical protein Hanom_Chr10g00904331 [Helianthus anomalus]